MTGDQALAFVKRHGVVLQSARGPVPSLAEEISGGAIRGSWWSHAKSHEIFQACQAVSDSAEVLVCRLVDGKVTYVHRRLWPALVKLSDRFKKDALAKVRAWVPAEVMKEAETLSVTEAEALLASLLRPAAKKKER